MKFSNLIYQDAEFFLKRKRKVFDIIEICRQNSCSRNSTSDFVGVNYSTCNKNFTSRATINGKRLYLGSFPTQEEAYKARLSFLKSKNMYISTE